MNRRGKGDQTGISSPRLPHTPQIHPNKNFDRIGPVSPDPDEPLQHVPKTSKTVKSSRLMKGRKLVIVNTEDGPSTISQKSILYSIISKSVPNDLANELVSSVDKLLESPSFSIIPSESLQKLVELMAEVALKARRSATSNAFSNAVETQSNFASRDQSKFPTAEDYLRHAYAGRLGIEGDLTRPFLRKIDPQLMTALDNQFKGRSSELEMLLPSVTARADQRLLSALGYIPQGAERKAALSSLGKGYRPLARK